MNADAEAKEWKDAAKKVPAMRSAAIEFVNAQIEAGRPGPSPSSPR